MNKQDIIKTLKIIVVALAVTLGTNMVFAVGTWSSAPTSGAPNDNVDAPLNVGDSAQAKKGGVSVGSLELPANGNIFSVTGNAFFSGTITSGFLNSTRRITAYAAGDDTTPADSEAIRAYRSPGSGYVALGVGSGTEPGAILNAPSNNLFIQSSAKYTRIGSMVTPRVALDVSGTVRATGDICTDLSGGKCLSQMSTGGTTSTSGGSSIGPVFITPVLVEGSSLAVPWTTYNAQGSVPSGAVAVILEAEASVGGPDSGVSIDPTSPTSDGSGVSHIFVRKTSSDSALLLLSGAAPGCCDTTAYAGQGVFPIASDRTFQYAVTPNAIAHRIRLIGYWQ